MAEGKGWQAGGVGEIADGVVGPGVTNGDGFWDCVRPYHDGCSVDAGVGVMPLFRGATVRRSDMCAQGEALHLAVGGSENEWDAFEVGFSEVWMDAFWQGCGG